MAFDPSYAAAIARIESGGRYDLLGPVTKSGDRAYGKYQVMGNNVGPWTKEVLGKELTPEQFVASPEAQDAVFQAQFGKYVDKYGPEGAAQAWFAGPGGVGKTDRKDQLGTSVGSYGQRFMASLSPDKPVQRIEPQKPLPPQPLNLAQARVPPLPAYDFTPQTPTVAQTPSAAPVLNAPQAAPISAPQPPPPPQGNINIAQYQGFTPLQWLKLFQG